MSVEQWKRTKLGDVIELITGFPFKSAQFTDDPLDTPLVRGDNIVQGKFRWDGVKRWNRHNTEDFSAYQLESGDVVLAMDRPWIEAGLKFARVTEHDLPCLLVQRVARMRAKPDLDPQFLRYVIGSRAFTDYILGVQTGTAVPHISGKQIQSFEFLCPPIAHQRTIGNELGTLDDKIELNRRMNGTLEAMARALFTSWFVDFDPVRAKAEGRLPAGMDASTAALFPDSFEDSPLGEIPRGWRVGRLGDVVSINARSMARDYPHDEISYIDISSVSVGRLDGAARHALSDAPSRAKRLVLNGDTIWSMVRPNRRSFLYINSPEDDTVVSTGFVVLTPESVPSTYLYAWTTTEEFVDYLTSNADGSAYPAVRPEHFERAVMLLSPSPVFAEFHRMVDPLRRRISHNESESRTLAAMRDALVPKLLSGELDLSVETGAHQQARV